MTKTSVKMVALVTRLSAFPLMVGVTGCAGDRYNQSTGHLIDDNRTGERGYNQRTDQSVEDSRMAERVREALAAGSDYKYDGVKVTACNGVVQLSGFVNTSAQTEIAVEVARRVAGVKSVEDNLAVKH